MKTYLPVLGGCVALWLAGCASQPAPVTTEKLDPKIRAMIQPNTDLSRLIEVAYTNGMRPLRASAAAQVARGVTTIPEVVNVLPPAEF